jgi:hypothetical protein
LKNFEPARSAAPALGCLRRRSASSGAGILLDGSLWRPRITSELTARAGGHFADTRPGSVRRVTRRHLASRATARPADDPAANADSGSVPSPETASGRSYLHENRRASSRRTFKRLIRNCPNRGKPAGSRPAEAPALRRHFPRIESHLAQVFTLRATEDSERTDAPPGEPPTNPL